MFFLHLKRMEKWFGANLIFSIDNNTFTRKNTKKQKYEFESIDTAKMRYWIIGTIVSIFILRKINKTGPMQPMLNAPTKYLPFVIFFPSKIIITFY